MLHRRREETNEALKYLTDFNIFAIFLETQQIQTLVKKVPNVKYEAVLRLFTLNDSSKTKFNWLFLQANLGVPFLVTFPTHIPTIFRYFLQRVLTAEPAQLDRQVQEEQTSKLTEYDRTSKLKFDIDNRNF